MMHSNRNNANGRSRGGGDPLLPSLLSGGGGGGGGGTDNEQKEFDNNEENNSDKYYYDDDVDDDDLMLDDCSLGSDDNDEKLDDDDDDGTAKWELRIRAASPFRDATVKLSPSSTVADLKRSVVKALGKDAADRYLRLVSRGRLLAPDAAVLQDLQFVRQDEIVHAVLAAVGQRGGPQAVLQRGLVTAASAAAAGGAASSQLSRRAFRGTGINAAGVAVRSTGSEEDDEDDDDYDDYDDYDEAGGAGGGWDVEQGRAAASSSSPRRERLGFDRLRRSGLRRAEVTALRAYFSRHVDRWVRQHPAAAEAAAGTESDPLRRRLLQEEAWMVLQGPASEFRINLAGATAAGLWGGSGAAATLRSGQGLQVPGGGADAAAAWRGGMSAAVGTDRDFLWGFMLGFFVGFFMLVWVWMPTVPHKQKLGILTGISFQLALNMLRGGSGGGDGGGDDDDVDGEGSADGLVLGG